MKVSSILANQGIKLLSGLGNNEDSLAAMVAKDWIGDGATVLTYKKQGGKDDWVEKGIEEFGTGAVWLFGIPAIKKIIDKTAYKFLGLNSEFDPKLLQNKDLLTKYSTLAKGSEKQLFDSLQSNNSVLKNISNSKLYKSMFVGKFAIATIASAFALNKIIKIKQDRTTKRIEKDIKLSNEQYGSILLQKNLKNNNFNTFTANKNAKNLAFTGGIQEFMYNPIKNTMILDAVIAGTRLKNARKGEHFEVGFKELCQIVFIYGLAKPLQNGFEWIGRKMKCPIELDPKVLFKSDLAEKLPKLQDSISELLSSKDILLDLSKMNTKNPLVKLLVANGAVNLTKEGDAISFLKEIDENSIKTTLKNLQKLNDNLGNLSKIKAFKTFAVIANVLIAAGIMGVAQPTISILLRKVMNKGDNRNPAIVAQEQKMKMLAYQA